MTEETIKKENAKLIAEAMREAVRTLASEATTARQLVASDAEKAVRIIKEDSGGFSSIMYKQVSFGLSIAGVLLGGFIFLTSPSQKNDVALQLQNQRINSQEETINALTKTSQNDVQEVKLNIALLTTKIEAQSIEIAKLTTIINERIPIKK